MCVQRKQHRIPRLRVRFSLGCLLAQGGVLRNNLRTSTGHMKAAAKQAGNRRDRRGGREPEDEDDDDFDQLVRTRLVLPARLSCV